MAEHEGPWSSLPPPASPPPRPGLKLGLPANRRLVIFVAILAAGAALTFVLARVYPNRVGGTGWGGAAMNLGFVALIAASLFSRGLKLGQALRYIGLWAAVFAVLAVGYVYRDDLTAVGNRLRSAIDPSHAVQTAPHVVILTESASGQYEATGLVNGQPVRFMVDTGSSDIVLSPDVAARLGAPATLKFDHQYETANGAGLGADWQVSSLAVGPIQFSGVPVSVNKTAMSSSLLGMSFLRRLDSYEFKGRQLILRSAPTH